MKGPSARLGIDIHESDDHVRVEIRGDVDLAAAPRLRSALIEAVHLGSPLVVVDLSGVDLLDSSGLGIIIGGLKRARTHGSDLVVRNPRPAVAAVLGLTGLDVVLGCSPAVSEP